MYDDELVPFFLFLCFLTLFFFSLIVLVAATDSMETREVRVCETTISETGDSVERCWDEDEVINP